MGWSKWIFIADIDSYIQQNLPEWQGPGCYELALSRKNGRTRKIVYIGETSNIRNRIYSYASYGSHIQYLIDDALKAGNFLYYRFQKKATKDDAILMQNNLLLKFNYEWNYLLNQ